MSAPSEKLDQIRARDLCGMGTPSNQSACDRRELLQMIDTLTRETADLRRERDEATKYFEVECANHEHTAKRIGAERDAALREVEGMREALSAAALRLEDWQFPNSQSIAEDIAADLRAALAATRKGDQS